MRRRIPSYEEVSCDRCGNTIWRSASSEAPLAVLAIQHLRQMPSGSVATGQENVDLCLICKGLLTEFLGAGKGPYGKTTSASSRL